jgi:hypothetical protein
MLRDLTSWHAAYKGIEEYEDARYINYQLKLLTKPQAGRDIEEYEDARYITLLRLY